MDQGEPDGQSPLGILRECSQGPSLGRNLFLLVARLGESCPESPLTITEVSKVVEASLLTKRDLRELLDVPDPLTQNQNVNELELNF